MSEVYSFAKSQNFTDFCMVGGGNFPPPIPHNTKSVKFCDSSELYPLYFSRNHFQTWQILYWFNLRHSFQLFFLAADFCQLVLEKKSRVEKTTNKQSNAEGSILFQHSLFVLLNSFLRPPKFHPFYALFLLIQNILLTSRPNLMSLYIGWFLYRCVIFGI